MSPIPFPDLSPEIFRIDLGGFSFALRWYALAYIVGLVAGWKIIARIVTTPRLWPAPLWPKGAPMTPAQVEALLTWVILGVVLGGRLGFVLFYQPGHYLQNPGQILRIWEGGMSFHGGFLGVVVAGIWFCRREGIPMLTLADLMAIVAPIGIGLGRLANFINAELWGRPTTLPWGVAFPGDAAQTCPGIIGLCGRHPSQLYEAALEGLILFLALLYVTYRRGWLSTPGRIAGLFFAGYGAGRFVVEFVRQPDAQFITEGNPLGLALHVGGWGLTMGQILSLPMIAAGIWFIARARRALRPT